LSTLTKILIVLLTVSSIFLCGIVVTWVANADSYKQKYDSQIARIGSLTEELGSLKKQLNRKIEEKSAQKAKLGNEIATLKVKSSELQTQLKTVEAEKSLLLQKVNNWTSVVEAFSQTADNKELLLKDTLGELMKDNGGFDHNLQGLRVVDELEERYPDFPGLNLTWEVREGINKHSTMFDKPKRLIELDPNMSPTLETQVVDIADEIAYDNHDIDDGLASGLLDEKGLLGLSLWKDALSDIKNKFTNLSKKIERYQIIRSLIDKQIKDLVETSENNLKTISIKNVSDVKRYPKKLISFSRGIQEKRAYLRDFLRKYLYRNFRVIRMSDKARRFIEKLFDVYLKKPEQLPPIDHEKIKKYGLHRAICDYIAGMTDRYALDEYKKLFDPYERV